jgi:hypothetical protein
MALFLIALHIEITLHLQVLPRVSNVAHPNEIINSKVQTYRRSGDIPPLILTAGVHAPTKSVSVPVTISVVLILHVIFMARQYTRQTRQSYRNDHRHVGVMMPATVSINTPNWCAEQVRTRLACDLTFCSADTDLVGACTSALTLSTRSRWVVSLTPLPIYSRGKKAPVPTEYEAGWGLRVNL